MKEAVLFHTAGFCLGILLDLIVGDPHKMPHPVRAMGNLILFLEHSFLTGSGTRQAKENDREQAADNESIQRNPKKERRMGTMLWLIVVFTVLLVSLGIMIGSCYVNRYLGIVIEAILTC